MTLGVVVNVRRPAPSPARPTRHCCQSLQGTEIGVASTKAFTCQLTVLAAPRSSYGLCLQRGTYEPAKKLEETLKAPSRRRLPGLIAQALRTMTKTSPRLAHLICAKARRYPLSLDAGSMITPSRMEGALKLKEISYIHAEGYASGELKHGPIALIDERCAGHRLCSVRDALFDKTISNMQEVHERAMAARSSSITDADGLEKIAGDGLHGK